MAAYEAKTTATSWRWLYVLMLWCGATATVAAIRGAWSRRDLGALLLILWFSGTLVFCVFFNWTINERIVLPAIFPAAVLAVPLDGRDGRSQGLDRRVRVGVVPTVVVSLLVAAADMEFADAGRTFARTTARQANSRGRNVYFAGHWGFQFYMEQEGAVPLDFRRPQLREGDLLVYPTYHTSGAPPDVPFRIVSDTKGLFANPWGVQTMDPAAGAGFYSSIFGNVPYAISREGLADRFFILEQSAGRAEPVESIAARTCQFRTDYYAGTSKMASISTAAPVGSAAKPSACGHASRRPTCRKSDAANRKRR